MTNNITYKKVDATHIVEYKTADEWATLQLDDGDAGGLHIENENALTWTFLSQETLAALLPALAYYAEHGRLPEAEKRGVDIS